MIRRKVKIALPVKLKKRECPKDRYQKEIAAVRKIKSIWSFRGPVLDSFSGVLEEKIIIQWIQGSERHKHEKEDDCSWESLSEEGERMGNWNTLNISYIF